MASMEEKMKSRMDKMIQGTSIERISDDEDVREWLLFGRMAMIFTLWAAMISAVALVISVRF
ncbi:hypothetical protein [Gymnodinialimonas hymeniacidonis]|uniref:hypothetical protein n=1 Tax=Gymnodinialimonas hymeniacidonis TaxID=3126508 RepID=UPI0034C67A9C